MTVLRGLAIKLYTLQVAYSGGRVRVLPDLTYHSA